MTIGKTVLTYREYCTTKARIRCKPVCYKRISVGGRGRRVRNKNHHAVATGWSYRGTVHAFEVQTMFTNALGNSFRLNNLTNIHVHTVVIGDHNYDHRSRASVSGFTSYRPRAILPQSRGAPSQRLLSLLASSPKGSTLTKDLGLPTR